MSTLDFRSHFRIEDQLLCQKSLLNFYEAKVSLKVGHLCITLVVMANVKSTMR